MSHQCPNDRIPAPCQPEAASNRTSASANAAFAACTWAASVNSSRSSSSTPDDMPQLYRTDVRLTTHERLGFQVFRHSAEALVDDVEVLERRRALGQAHHAPRELGGLRHVRILH